MIITICLLTHSKCFIIGKTLTINMRNLTSWTFFFFLYFDWKIYSQMMKYLFLKVVNPQLLFVVQRTALQWACLNGHQDIVQLLLPTSIMEQRVWQDNSEFYSASLAGNIEIIRCLFQQHSCKNNSFMYPKI